MAEEKKPTQELIEIPELMSVPVKFSTGPTMGRFLREIKDHKKIMANRCPKCRRTQLPPRIVCADCDVEVTEWVELPNTGRVTSYDVVFIPTLNPLTGKMREVPYTTFSVIFDGSDATLMHFLDENDPKKIEVGQRVEAVYRADNERTGSVLDILYFHLIPGQVDKEGLIHDFGV